MKKISSWYVQDIMNVAKSVNIVGTVTEERILEIDGVHQVVLRGYTGYIDNDSTEQYIRQQLAQANYKQQTIDKMFQDE